MADKFLDKNEPSVANEKKRLSAGNRANSLVDSPTDMSFAGKMVRDEPCEMEHDWDTVNFVDVGISNGRKFRRQRRNTYHGIDNGGFSRFGKREFERRSGSNKTGLKAVEKRAGAGAHNWGSIKVIVDSELELMNENTRVMNLARRHTMPNTNEQLQVRNTVRQHMTLDEWKAMQHQQTENSFALRKAGEGCVVDPEWTRMRALDKKDRLMDQTVMNHRQPKEHPLQTVIPIEVGFIVTKHSSIDDESDVEFKSRDITSSMVPNVTSEIDFPSLS